MPNHYFLVSMKHKSELVFQLVFLNSRLFSSDRPQFIFCCHTTEVFTPNNVTITCHH